MLGFARSSGLPSPHFQALFDRSPVWASSRSDPRTLTLDPDPRGGARCADPAALTAGPHTQSERNRERERASEREREKHREKHTQNKHTHTHRKKERTNERKNERKGKKERERKKERKGRTSSIWNARWRQLLAPCSSYRRSTKSAGY
eukprot:2392436-Rhodomonas_salina.1